MDNCFCKHELPRTGTPVLQEQKSASQYPRPSARYVPPIDTIDCRNMQGKLDEHTHARDKVRE